MKLYLKRYGLWGFLRLMTDIIFTRLLYPKARIIRLPNYIRGRNHISIGNKLTTGVGLRIDALPHDRNKIVLRMGDEIELNDYVHIVAVDSVEIGNHVLIASKVFITDNNHGNYSGEKPHDNPNDPPKKRKFYSSPVLIEDNVWIGESVTILQGVTIGKGSIIGAMSLVNRNIPPFSIALGVPARVIKRFNFENNQWEKI